MGNRQDLQELLEQWDPEEYVAWLERDFGDETGRGEKQPEPCTTYEEMTPKHANPDGKVHGGEIIKQMDSLAGITAKRYAGTDVVTASVDQVAFHEPVDIGDMLYLESRIDYVGTSSMMIHVDVYVEDHHNDTRDRATDAYFTFVALNEDGEPTSVPELVLETEEEQERYRTAKQVKDYLDDR